MKYLIAGLGNIGAEYVNTRHNIGFVVCDALAKDLGTSFTVDRLASRAEARFKGRTLIMIKPTTYMNLSGKSIKYWMDKENVPLENVLVITDDINLSFGTFRLKTKGSDGGHNGLKDIQNVLQTTKYNRLRFGVGADFGKGRQVDYVLGKWNDVEKEQLEERLNKSCELIRSFVLSGINITMNQFNGT